MPLGSTFTLSVNYDVTDGDNTLSGLDISIHFDSSKISYNDNDYSDFLDVGDIKSPPSILDDTLDEDSDPNTDKRINMSWSSIAGEWPNVDLPTVLTKLNFTLNEGFSEGQTAINVSVFDSAPSHTFFGKGSTISAQTWNLDIDCNAGCKPLTDGLLAIRYLFRYHLGGEAWIDGIVAPDATRKTATEIEAWLADAVSGLMLDIDGNGECKPLTDGLLVVRYLFRYHLGGETWIDGIVAPDATRKTAAEIEAYLLSIMAQ